MRKSPTLAFLALLLAAPTAFAHDKEREDAPWYLQLTVGAVGANDAEDIPVLIGGSQDLGFDTGISTSLILGHDMGGGDSFGWSLEGEAYYAYYEADKDDVGVLSGPGAGRGTSAYMFMGNVVFDWHLTSNVAWYMGGGAGWSPRVEFDTLDSGSYTQDDKDGACGQFKTGLKFHLGGTLDFLLGYRFLTIPDLDFFDTATNRSFDADYETHIFEFGMRWGL